MGTKKLKVRESWAKEYVGLRRRSSNLYGNRKKASKQEHHCCCTCILGESLLFVIRTKNLVAKLWSNGMIRSRQGSVIVFRSNVFGGCLDVWKRERGAFFGLSFQSSFVYYWLWINQSSNDSCLSYLPANQGDGLSHLPTNRPLRPIDLIRNQRICRQVDDLFTTFFCPRFMISLKSWFMTSIRQVYVSRTSAPLFFRQI